MANRPNAARVRSPIDKLVVGRSSRSAASPSFASWLRASTSSHPTWSTNARSNVGAAENNGRSCARRPGRTDGPRRRVPDVSGSSPSSALIKVVFPEPFEPVIRIRSLEPTTTSMGPKTNDPRSMTAPANEAASAPTRSASSKRRCRSHGFHGAVTASLRSRRSSARCVCFALLACFSLASVLNARMNLSGSPLVRTRATPWSDHSRWRWARPAKSARFD